jgi:rod shape determining protein RodA
MRELVPLPRAIAALPWRILFVIAAIGGFGLVILYSAAGSLTPWASTQGIRFVALFVAMILISHISPNNWAKVAIPAYVIVAAALLGVEVLGAVSGGSQRWLDLGVIRIQPSEMMKLAVVLAIARFYAGLPRAHIRSPVAVWPALAMIALPAAMVMMQPDLGTALMIIFGGVGVMFLAGLPLWLFIGTGGAFAAMLPVALSLLHDYQRRRVLIFLNPESDPLGAGYHISQSKIAIGSGGLFGKGFLSGTQGRLDYLPELHTDFIFATMAEEWGFAGGIFLLALFGMLLAWGWQVSLRATERFDKLAAGGLTLTIFYYVAINLMMVMGLAPVVGIPLPLVSYGGSAMMTVMLCLGILLGIDRKTRAAGSRSFE